jgi:two-component system cell cycle response regulator
MGEGDSDKKGGDITTRKITSSVQAVGKKVPTLVILHGRGVGNRFILNKPSTTVGRIPDNDIEINDPLVSRKHSRIVQEAPDKFVLIDLGSTNGTYLNDGRIEEAGLTDGDKVKIGETVLRFSFQDEVDIRYMDEIMALIHLDNLTGLLRKRTFDYELDKVLFNYRERGEPVSVTMMDLDHFKDVNDTYGHTTGSYIISRVGEIIRNILAESGVGGRFGGEEFVAFFPGLDREQAWVVCNKLRRELEGTTFHYEGISITITISMGISEYPRDGDDPKTLVKKADQALYQAKGKGRNCVFIFGLEDKDFKENSHEGE